MERLNKKFHYIELLIEKVPFKGKFFDYKHEYFNIQYYYDLSPKNFYPICSYENDSKSYGLSKDCFYNGHLRLSFKRKPSFINYGENVYCWNFENGIYMDLRNPFEKTKSISIGNPGYRIIMNIVLDDRI